MLVDLHAHSAPASRDAADPIEPLAAALGALGVDAVALTDHGGGCDYAQASAVLAEYGVLLVPGREIAAPIGHVLVLSTDAEWLAGLPERSALPVPGRPRGPVALVWAHPAGWRVAGAMIAPDASKGASHLHGVEVLNGERLYQPGGVEIASALARDHGLSACGGSDAHRAGSAGRCLTEAAGARTAGEVIEAVREGRVRPVLGRAWAAANDVRYEREDLAAYTWPEGTATR